MFANSKGHQTPNFDRVKGTREPTASFKPFKTWFDPLVLWLKRIRNMISLAKARFADSSLPKASSSITFGDGYADNGVNILPIPPKFRVPVAFLVASGKLDGGRM